MRILGHPFYLWYVISGQRARVRRNLAAYEAADLPEVRADTAKRFEPSAPELMDVSNFDKFVTTLERRFHQFSYGFASLLRSGDFFHDWVIRLGFYLGDFVILHSINKAEWTQNERGLWAVRFQGESADHLWSPFEFVEQRYFFGEPGDLFLSLDIFRKLKR